MTYNPRGFKAIQGLIGNSDQNLKQFEVSAASDKAYFPGGVVRLKSNGKVTHLAASASAQTALGVVTGVYSKSDDGKPQALTFNQPTGGTYLSTAQTGFVLVNLNPNQEYLASLDVSASAGLVGQTVDVSGIGTGNTRVGYSTESLAGATLGTGSDGVMMITGIFDDLSGNSDKPAPSAVKVKLNGTVFSGTSGV